MRRSLFRKKNTWLRNIGGGTPSTDPCMYAIWYTYRLTLKLKNNNTYLTFLCKNKFIMTRSKIIHVVCLAFEKSIFNTGTQTQLILILFNLLMFFCVGMSCRVNENENNIMILFKYLTIKLLQRICLFV